MNVVFPVPSGASTAIKRQNFLGHQMTRQLLSQRNLNMPPMVYNGLLLKIRTIALRSSSLAKDTIESKSDLSSKVIRAYQLIN